MRVSSLWAVWQVSASLSHTAHVSAVLVFFSLATPRRLLLSIRTPLSFPLHLSPLSFTPSVCLLSLCSSLFLCFCSVPSFSMCLSLVCLLFFWCIPLCRDSTRLAPRILCLSTSLPSSSTPRRLLAASTLHPPVSRARRKVERQKGGERKRKALSRAKEGGPPHGPKTPCLPPSPLQWTRLFRPRTLCQRDGDARPIIFLSQRTAIYRFPIIITVARCVSTTCLSITKVEDSVFCKGKNKRCSLGKEAFTCSCN